jgi:hypothetical protein
MQADHFCGMCLLIIHEPLVDHVGQPLAHHVIASATLVRRESDKESMGWNSCHNAN